MTLKKDSPNPFETLPHAPGGQETGGIAAGDSSHETQDSNNSTTKQSKDSKKVALEIISKFKTIHHYKFDVFFI